MLVGGTFCLQGGGVSRVFVVVCGVPLFSRRRIDLCVRSGVWSACVRRSLVVGLWFPQGGVLSWKTIPGNKVTFSCPFLQTQFSRKEAFFGRTGARWVGTDGCGCFAHCSACAGRSSTGGAAGCREWPRGLVTFPLCGRRVFLIGIISYVY